MRQYSRRSVLAAGAASAALAAAPAVLAQAKPKLRCAAVFSEQDIRAEAFRMFGREVGDMFDFEAFFGGTLFKQGTELVAMQRGNLEMANIAPQDISKQIPAWSILTAAYLFRDADHMQKTFDGPIGAEFKKMARDQLGVHVLTPVYFGTRQVNLRTTKKINTPADMAGIKLRMPPGEAWQLLGEAMGANPTPVAFAELYTALQSGAVDGQDNPLPTSRTMKFHEVTKQFVLTGHLVGYDVFSVSAKIWDSMKPDQQQKFQAAAVKAIASSTAKHLAQEKEMVDFFKSQGLEVYSPDVAAFRASAQTKYLASDLAKDWPKGMLERINAVR
ncbi:MAG TPA: sialic acid TRAP transporter substrate-binding protein SiaP [Alphaproteobacteria bacterium]|jgi:TRAP-type C4-dicarboxylate transport system substrate-binding protein|nr:sialic acid TRAP transporter substrate-binding protein SiaP [Alphaproteobacteria bacterium]